MGTVLTNERSLFMGADLGGSRTRVVLINHAGKVEGRADGPGLNWLSTKAFEVPPETISVFQRAIGRHGSHVAASLIGVAGILPFQTPPTAAFADALPDLGTEPVVMGDLELLFRSFVGWRAGIAQVAGTGAIGARFSTSELVRVVDGNGPTLGDAGSGYWIGRAALEATLRELDNRVERTGLSQLVLDHLIDTETVPRQGSGGAQIWSVIRAVDQGGQKLVAGLAKLVVKAATARNVEARGIIFAAADALTASLAALNPQPEDAIVLGGSLLSNESILSAAVMDWVDARGLRVTIGHDTALAAAQFAASTHHRLRSRGPQ